MLSGTKERLASPSSILMFMQCPRKYYYRYVKGLEGKPSIHLVVGGVVHSSIQSFHNINIDYVPSKGFFDTLNFGMTQFFDKNWEEKRHELEKLGLTPNELRFHYDEASLMLDNFVRHHIRKMLAQQHRLNLSPQEAFRKLRPDTEKKIISEKMGVMGVIDAIRESDRGTTIIDYKTSKKNEIDHECKVQLAIYSILYRESYGRLPDKVGVHFLRHGEKIIKVTPDLIALGEKKCDEIKTLTRSLKEEDYTRKKSGLCKYRTGQCDYYETCKPRNSVEFA